MKLENYLQKITPLSESAMKEAKGRWDHIAKPLNSLGILEDAVVKIAGIAGNCNVKLDKKAVVIMCGDNGVVEEGVSQTGSSVTAIVTRNFTYGNASVCIMADQANTDCIPVDIGVAEDLKDLGTKNPLLLKKISYGTKNMAKEPAMTEDEVLKALEIGISLAGELKEKGYHILATGEMGIGNTTTSSAVASVLMNQPVGVVAGRGAGLSNSGLDHKIKVIEEAISLHKPDPSNPIEVLSKLGGLDIAGLAGIFLGGAIYKIPIVIDGFISAAAALAAVKIHGECINYMLASHVSKEPGGRKILDVLQLKPMLVCEMCLGEGTGAVAALPILDMAVHVYEEMSTFQEIHVEKYEPLS